MIHFEARSVQGRPLATFDSMDKLQAFKADRASRGVNVRGVYRPTDRERDTVKMKKARSYAGLLVYNSR